MLLNTLRKFQPIQQPHLRCKKSITQKTEIVRQNSSVRTMAKVLNSHLVQYLETFCLSKGRCVCVLSRAQLFAASWTVAHQAPLSMEFSRQEYWSGLPFPSPGDLPNSGIEPASLLSPAHTKHLTIPQSKQEWKKLEL